VDGAATNFAVAACGPNASLSLQRHKFLEYTKMIQEGRLSIKQHSLFNTAALNQASSDQVSGIYFVTITYVLIKYDFGINLKFPTLPG
jgi:hypothetical protein